MKAALRWSDGGSARSHTLSSNITTIGRNDDNAIVLASAQVSRYHARIDWAGAEYLFEDLHSTNGSWLNGEQATAPCALKDGDVLRLGDCELVFAVEGAETTKGRSLKGGALRDGLTERECEVLALLANGRSNREIAASLVLSERTVARHITNIYAKIDARGRADATAYALKHGIA